MLGKQKRAQYEEGAFGKKARGGFIGIHTAIVLHIAARIRRVRDDIPFVLAWRGVWRDRRRNSSPLPANNNCYFPPDTMTGPQRRNLEKLLSGNAVDVFDAAVYFDSLGILFFPGNLPQTMRRV